MNKWITIIENINNCFNFFQNKLKEFLKSRNFQYYLYYIREGKSTSFNESFHNLITVYADKKHFFKVIINIIIFIC